MGDIKVHGMEHFPGLVWLSDVKEVKPRWIWEPYIREGKLSVLRGDPGVGKTYFIAGIMAAIAGEEQPENMPGVLHKTRGRCLYFGSEDDQEVMLSRVKSGGGISTDIGRIALYKNEVYFYDTDRIGALIVATGADLVVFDPLQSFLGRQVDMNRANEIRPLLNRIKALAENLRVGVLIVEHKNKNINGNALYRGIGTMDITAAARSVLMIERDPEDPFLRSTSQIKTNLKQGAAIRWSIEEDGTFTWRGSSESWDKEAAARASLSFSPGARCVLHIMKRYPDGWRGTSSDILKECEGIAEGMSAKTLGRELGSEDTRRKLRDAYGIEVYITRPGNRNTYNIKRGKLTESAP